ncbi:myb family transcription factor EFM-like [Andrographis paniculata]|uniref:myb family transcription factor EFM-like n=1 Tax=Andrographis paniculata TaxID=175694 RepID=UPI0021E740CA|nr:myb family transcription factor EFM-like [Andrographis paniculata]
MMAPPSDLCFDFKPQIASMLLKSCGDYQTAEGTQKLEEFVARLEEERLKIDAFKRELPLCMQLLTNATEVSRQQLQTQRSSRETITPVLEEFIPLRNPNSSHTAENDADASPDQKSSWMTSAQLWNQAECEGTKAAASQSFTTSDQETDIKLALNGQQRMINNGGGAFHPFTSNKDRVSPSSCGETFPELALASSAIEDKRNSPEPSFRRDRSASKYGNHISGAAEKEQSNNSTQRKARRCWSPDLHRRFVNALQMLGGSQVATPKQIRELMKVDGLTNDEVKSHLQKYRLHTRRPSPSSQAAVTAGPQVVVLGGIWVPPEYAAAAAAAHGGAPGAALYGAHAAASTAHHHVPPPLCAPPPPRQEIYPAIAAAAAPHSNSVLHHSLHHHNLQYNKPPLMQKNASPESGVRGGGAAGDPSESIEDGKSESGSWKADSGGGGGDARQRLDGEDSNASVVSLKF